MKQIGLILLLVAWAFGSALAADKPNVLLVVCDDLNTRLGCYSDRVVKTPNIDALAARGVRFDKAYCQYPVCNPSRTSFLSGMRPQTSGVLDQASLLRAQKMPSAVYLPEHFKANGYFTAGIGKVEHGGHYEIRWDVADDFKGRGAADEDEAARPRRGGTRPATRLARTSTRRPGMLTYEVKRATADSDPENTDDRIADRVIGLMREKRDKPFFIAAGFHKPHVPHVAPRRFFDLYPVEMMPLTQVPEDDATDIPAMALASPRNYQPDMSDARKRDIISAYYACTSYLDDRFGQVLAELDRLGLRDSTLVVFLGDHGWHFGEHNWWAKASLFEASARAPLIVAGPGIRAGVCGRVVEFLDIAPTLTELCALPPMPQGQGKSLAPLLDDPARPWVKPAYTALGERGRSIRTERYRYTEWNTGQDGIELYDYETDPDELTNLAGDPAHEGIVRDLSAQLRAAR